jgi:hypothetical protein
MGYSRFGRLREVMSKTREIIDGLVHYRLQLACGHVMLIAAGTYGPNLKSRRCPNCRAGNVANTALLQARALRDVPQTSEQRDEYLDGVVRDTLGIKKEQEQ